MSVFIEKIISFLIFIGFSFFLIMPKGGLIILAILVLSCIGLFLNMNIKKELENWEKLLLIGFIGYFFLILSSNYFFNGDIREIDSASRFILVIPIFFFLRKSNVHNKSLEYGVILACVLFGLNSILPKFFDMNQFFQFSKHEGIVSLYGAILGVTTLFFASKSNSLIYNFIILISAFLGIATSLLAGGRGVWIAAFLTFLILYYMNPLRWSKLEKVLIISTGVIILLIGYVNPVTGVKARIEQALSELDSYYTMKVSSSSVGARLEMWKSSYYIFKANPIFGIGEGNFKQKNIELIEEGIVDSEVEKFNHPHGEFISTAVEQGLLGLSFLLYFFLNPLIKCYKEFKHKDNIRSVNIPILLVMSLVLHFFFYSMTNGVFDHQNTSLFFAAYVTIGMSLFSSIKDKV